MKKESSNRGYMISLPRRTNLYCLCTVAFLSLAPDNSVMANNFTMPKAISEALQAKKIKITGLITEQNGDPVIGATVMEKGTTNGTITDIDGRYTINIPIGAIMQCSYVGYGTQEKKINENSSSINFRLVEDTEMLGDVVVVGFGRQKKASVVGAISTVKPEAFKLPTSSLSSSLAGRMSGVIAVQRSGEPGSDGADFWIRGVGTNGANSKPLILLDGVEVSAGDMNDIQPDDIESFSILKDASATALYGVRGANGVMIVTTKIGASDEKMKISARVENSWSMPSYDFKMTDGITYMNMYNEALINDDPNATPMYSSERIEATKKGLNPYLFPNVNWKNEIFKSTTMNQRANVNVSGGSKIAQYYISAGIYRDQGLFKEISHGSFKNNIDVRRYNFQANVNANVTKTTKLGLKLSTVIQDMNGPMTNAATTYQTIITRTNPVNFPVMFPAGTGPVGNESNILYGNMNFGGSVYTNPYAEIAKGYKDDFSTTVISTFDIRQDLSMVTKGLSLRGLFSYKNWSTSSISRSTVPYYYQVNGYTGDADSGYEYTVESINSNGTDYLQYSNSNNGDRTIYWEAAIDYSRVFDDKHAVTGMLLYNQRQYNPTIPGNLFNAVPYRTTGLAGRFTYGYDNRYFAEFNFGYNGTENFAKDSQFGFFPSIALGYTISNEKFFDPLKNVISDLKIRGSYGLVGNDKLAGARFPYLTEISMGSGPSYTFGDKFQANYTGVSFTRIGNLNAKWEVGYKANVGIDLELFKSLNLTIDYFSEKRTGIFKQPGTIPGTLGFGSIIPYYNLGEVKNGGIDASFTYNKALGRNWILNLQGNFIYAHNKVVKDEFPDQLYQNLSGIGHPVNAIWGFNDLGLFIDENDIINSAQQLLSGNVKPGDIKYQDITNHIDGKNTITTDDKMVIGNPTVPEIVYGFGGTLRYKKADFGIFFQGTARTSFIMGASTMAPFGRWNANVAQWIADDYWSPANPNPNAGYPRLSALGNENNTSHNSTYWLRDGSFLKLKNIEVGYSLKHFRVYANATNLLTFSNFKLWDPEMGGNGFYQYPTQRVFNLGIQFNFN